MFKNKSKALIAAALIALILTASIGGTIAYLTTHTGPVENTFTAPTTDVDITDEVEGEVKKDVVITNKSSYPVYIRVAIVANWRDAAGNIVAPWMNTASEGEFAGLPGEYWVKYGDYYYYTLPVAAGQTTGAPLFTSYTIGTKPNDAEGNQAAYLEMDLLVQAVQAEPADAAKELWGVAISQDSVTAATN